MAFIFQFKSLRLVFITGTAIAVATTPAKINPTPTLNHIDLKNEDFCGALLNEGAAERLVDKS